MAETVTPLLPVMIDQSCDSCSAGVMRPVLQKGLQAVPAGGFVNRGVLHQCSHCGQQSTYADSYPIIQYVNFLDFIKDSQAVLDQLKRDKVNG